MILTVIGGKSPSPLRLLRPARSQETRQGWGTGGSERVLDSGHARGCYCGGEVVCGGDAGGNLQDISLRAIEVLKEVDLIACEDTRHTQKLLAHFNIGTATVSYHEHNERERRRRFWRG